MRQVIIPVVSVVILLLIVLISIVGALRESATEEPADDTPERRALNSNPYAGSKRVPIEELQHSGVIRHTDDAYAGVNIYTCTYNAGAQFLDMAGEKIFELFDEREQIEQGWELVKPYFQDGFLVLIEDKALFRIDWESDVIWEIKDRFHHDIDIAANGDIYALRNQKIDMPSISPQEPILDNEVVIVSADGEIKRVISLAKIIANSPRLMNIVQNIDKKQYSYQPDAWDIMHTNTIDVIEEDIVYRGRGVFEAGQVLLCMRHLNLILVLDMVTEEIVWHFGEGHLEGPHQPSMIESKSLLVFDNGIQRGFSRIVQIDPGRSDIEREIEDIEGESFYTMTRGSVQHLPNDNLLIVVSDKGKVVEISKEGEVVWEFLSFPSKTQPGERELLYRMPRIVQKELLQKMPRTLSP